MPSANERKMVAVSKKRNIETHPNAKTNYLSAIPMLGKKYRTLKKTRQILDSHSGGVSRHMDCNATILKLLDEKAPVFIAKHHWVKGWLKGQGEFLMSLYHQSNELTTFNMVFANRKLLSRMRWVLGYHTGGVYKRIDENRELLELLLEQTPEFIQQHGLVVSWIKSQDDFLCELAAHLPPTEMRFKPTRNKSRGHVFPRPWPSIANNTADT